MAKVMVAMSGGVDSSVAALLLKQQGYTVFGATMQLWSYDRSGGNIHNESGCCSLLSIRDAQKVCWHLGVQHHVFNFCDLFEAKVIDPFYHAYRAGHTPNPCVLCNQEMKWNALLRKAEAIGCDYLATGHYARLRKGKDGRVNLCKGSDKTKDQSYFLWAVDEQALQHTLFPLGAFSKQEVKKIAKAEKLPLSPKPESQEVCFVPDNDYIRFLHSWAEQYRDTIAKGDIVDMRGRVVGRHAGVPFYTVGQRKSIGAHGSKRKYVVAVDVSANRIVIGDNADLYKAKFRVRRTNWIGISLVHGQALACCIRVRYQQSEKPGMFRIGDSDVEVEYDEPQRAITPGQSAVFYEEDRLLGGGVISRIER